MGKKWKALVVEDDYVWSDRLKKTLEENDFEVDVAITIEEALQILDSGQNFHFVSIDLQLKKETTDEKEYEGWQVLDKTHEVGLGNIATTLVLTAYLDEDEIMDIAKVYRHGAMHFMSKAKWDRERYVSLITQTVEQLNISFRR